MKSYVNVFMKIIRTTVRRFLENEFLQVRKFELIILFSKIVGNPARAKFESSIPTGTTLHSENGTKAYNYAGNFVTYRANWVHT